MDKTKQLKSLSSFNGEILIETPDESFSDIDEESPITFEQNSARGLLDDKRNSTNLKVEISPIQRLRLGMGRSRGRLIQNPLAATNEPHYIYRGRGRLLEF